MTVDGYIAGFDGRVKARLEQMRKVVRETVPDAEESMSYGMPAYKSVSYTHLTLPTSDLV